MAWEFSYGCDVDVFVYLGQVGLDSSDHGMLIFYDPFSVRADTTSVHGQY